MGTRDRRGGSGGGDPSGSGYRRATTLEADPAPRPRRRRAVTEEAHRALGDESVVLTLLRGPQAGRQFRLGRVTVLGRGEDADISLVDADISRHHARIIAHADGTHVLEDLRSRNGTRVNGEAVDRWELTVGDHIGLGAHNVLVFSRRSAAEEQLLEIQKLESLGRLAGGIAHDFNNILAVVLGNVELARRLTREGNEDPATIVEYLDDVLAASERARDLVKQLLGFARRGEWRESSIDLAALVREVAGLAGRTFDRSIRVHTEVEPGLLAVGDRTQLFQMLMNLCLNARDAMPQGGELLLRASRAAGEPLLLEETGAWILIEVVDSGVGIDEEARRRIFEPFYTTKGAGHGTGLGLAVVYGIVSRHGGRIAVQSEPGQGTRFRITLPEADPEQIREKADEVTLTPPSLSGRPVGEERIALVVDDEELVRRSVGRMLKRLGYQVVTAANGLEAQERLRDPATPVSLMVLDLIMPEMDGVETLRWLHDQPSQVPVVVMSGYQDDQVRESLAGLAVAGFLAKPFTERQLQAAVNVATAYG